MSACKKRPVDRRRPVARTDAAQARRGLPEAAQHRPAVRRGRDLPQPFHPVRALRAGAGQPAHQPVPDEPPGGAEHHPARRPLHQPGARAAARRLRPGPGRLHHDHARSAHHGAQRSALLRAGRHHGGLPLRSARSRIATPISAGWRARASSCPRSARTSGCPKGRPAPAPRRGRRASRRSCRTRPGSPSAASPTCAAAPASRGSCISATTARTRLSSPRRPTTRCTGRRTCRGRCARPRRRRRPGRTRCSPTM